MKYISTIALALLAALAFANSSRADLTQFDAQRMITQGCGELIRKASFTISPACAFRVEGLQTHDSTDGPVVDITVFSDGFLYDIYFIARYRLKPSGDHELVDVMKLR